MIILVKPCRADLTYGHNLRTVDWLRPIGPVCQSLRQQLSQGSFGLFLFNLTLMLCCLDRILRGFSQFNLET